MPVAFPLCQRFSVFLLEDVIFCIFSVFDQLIYPNILKIILEHLIAIINSFCFLHQSHYIPFLPQSASWQRKKGANPQWWFSGAELVFHIANWQ